MAGRELDIQAGITYPLTVDVEGGALNLFPGYSTGLGRSFVSIKKAGVGLTSSSTLNTHVDGLIVGGFKTLVDNTVVSLIHLTVAVGTATSGFLHYSVEAYSTTDYQVEVGMIMFMAANKAGVYTTDFQRNFGGAVQHVQTSGTLTCTWTLSDGVDINVNANTSLTPITGFPRISYSILNLGNQAITLL